MVADEVRLLRGGRHLVELKKHEVAGPAGALRAAGGVIWDPGRSAEVRMLLRSGGFDVVHVHNLFPALSPAVIRVARERRVPVVMTLHDLNLISRYADRLCLLVEGEIKALGTPETVLEPELLSQVYHVPLQRIRSERGGRPIILPTVL